ncbi:MAG: hypothetical protein ACI8P3_004074 [Saprospiraceae bacterium]|jgi:hypothetical protein
MAKKKTINVEGTDIGLLQENKNDYISLTDIDRRFDGSGRHIENWLRNQNTIEYLEVWEELYNPDFNSMQLHGIKEKIGVNRFLLSATKWIELTNAIGIQSKTGRYGGTFAHPDIAFNFCLWLSPRFQLYIVKEFQRLKSEESKALNTEWDVKRIMSKANYRIHTEAVRTHLIPPKLQYTKKEGLFFANEADLINMALFGITAKEWKQTNPKLKGNMRDHATTEQLLVLSNLQALNASLVEWDSDQVQRLELLNKAAIDQMSILLSSKSLDSLKPKPDKKKLK